MAKMKPKKSRMDPTPSYHFGDYYHVAPFPLLDVISRNKGITARDLASHLGYIGNNSKYNAMCLVLLGLYNEKILVRRGGGCKTSPYQYSLNGRNRLYYLLAAMVGDGFETLRASSLENRADA